MSELSSELLQKIRRIELKAGHFVEEAFSGGRLSAFRGQGMEWEDVREYVPGDDVRRIDWKVTARLGITQVKQFREEREIVFYLLIDISRSSLFGTVDQLRADIQAELAAVLALCTTRNNDRIGVIFFDHGVAGHIPPSSGKSHVFKVIREIIAREKSDLEARNAGPIGSGSRLTPAVDLLCRLRKRKTAVFLLSDLILEDFEDALSRLSRRHEVQVIWLRDSLEYSLPEIGLLPVHDAESGQMAWVDFGNIQAREQFNRIAMNRQSTILQITRRSRCPLLVLDNDKHAVDSLVQYLRTGVIPRFRNDTRFEESFR